jgi:hypothetical protein
MGAGQAKVQAISYHKRQNIMPSALIKFPASGRQAQAPLHSTRDNPPKEAP